ncbi:MAG: DNA-directed RNA polymerase subunit omega [Spirochaetales bacterium]|nr:DNA-directed RNA polymerase subunit omega [Spirochaetales bacterium]RKX82307.1 MAG: DNA-directed RNA polymerase subunit omega [Spirochaetota bacterium]
MIIPIDKLISYEGNIYQLTSAVIKRAIQINLVGDEELEKNKGKIVSIALKQILTEKVKYHIEA